MFPLECKKKTHMYSVCLRRGLHIGRSPGKWRPDRAIRRFFHLFMDVKTSVWSLTETPSCLGQCSLQLARLHRIFFIAGCIAKPMFYVIYLLTSPSLRAPSVLGRIISSCPLKTIETLSLGFFTRPSAPLRTARSCLCLSAKRLFQRLTTVTYFV